MHEFEPGPSWGRPNWPVTELDPVNPGLDPTDAVIEQVADKAKAVAQAAGADADAVRRAAEESIRAMMLIRTYRVRGHLAAKLDPLGLYQERAAGRSDAGLSRLRRHRARPADLPRRRAGLRKGQHPRDRRRAAVDLLRPHRLRIYAHQRPRRAPLHPGPDRGRGRDRPVHARGQELDPREGHPRRAVGEIPRPQICRHQALRAGRRRVDDPGAGSGDQIWRPDGRRGDRPRHGPPRPPQRPLQRHGQALPRHLPRVRGRRHQPGRRRRLGRRQIPPRHLAATASSTASASICRCCPTRRIWKRSIRSCSARRGRCRR